MELCREIRESVLKELDYQFRVQEEREEARDRMLAERDEEHYKRMDELLRKKNPVSLCSRDLVSNYIYFFMYVRHSATPFSAVETVMPLAMHLQERLNRQSALHATHVSTELLGLLNSAAASMSASPSAFS